MSIPTRLALTAALAASFTAIGHAAPVTGQGTWQTTLKARDINGNAVSLDSASAAFFYDTTQNITWLADMNQNGLMNWSTAVAWADSLTSGGFDDWRLPTVIDSGAAGCDSSNAGTDCGYNVQTQVGNAYSEWAHLFHVTLGNLAAYDTSGAMRGGSAGVDWGLTNTAYFQNMQSGAYWSGTQFAPNPSGAWSFVTFRGSQGAGPKSSPLHAVAVRSGDVLRDGGTVPEPHTLALTLLALGVATARRHARTAPQDRNFGSDGLFNAP